MRGVPYRRQEAVALDYKGHRVGQARLDLLVGDALILELKTVDALCPVHYAQVLSYLKAPGCELGLLINFNVPVLKDGIKRVILT